MTTASLYVPSLTKTVSPTFAASMASWIEGNTSGTVRTRLFAGRKWGQTQSSANSPPERAAGLFPESTLK